MSARHPAPWRAEGRDNGKRGRQRREFWAVLDCNEFFVAEGLDETTAREVVEAVNGRESLFADMKIKETEMRLKVDAAEKERTESSTMILRAKEWHSVWLKENEKLRDKLDASEAVNSRLREALKQIIDATYDIDMGCPDFRAIARAAIGEEKR